MLIAIDIDFMAYDKNVDHLKVKVRTDALGCQ